MRKDSTRSERESRAGNGIKKGELRVEGRTHTGIQLNKNIDVSDVGDFSEMVVIPCEYKARSSENPHVNKEI